MDCGQEENPREGLTSSRFWKQSAPKSSRLTHRHLCRVIPFARTKKKNDAEATLKQLQDTMEYVSDDYYDLLVSPDSLDDQAGQGKERKRKVTKRK